MFERRSLKGPITLGVIMIVLLVALIVGWILLLVFGSTGVPIFPALYWTLLTLGTTFLALVLVGVVMYLALTVKAFSLNRRQSNFVDSVTHELKSPIASLKLYLQTLNRHPVAPDQQQAFFRDMLEDVERLDQLINHLLDAARLDKTPLDGELQDVSLDAVLARRAAEVRLRYGTPDSAVRVDAEPLVVRARPGDLEIIFRNLIDNAVKYAGTPPEVEIVARANGDDRAVVEVRDNGPGVPRHFRRKIFRRFVRMVDELKRDKPGTGLGLYIVQTLVARLPGRIKVRDREPAPGTVFEVHLPARTAATDPPEDNDGAPSADDAREARIA